MTDTSEPVPDTRLLTDGWRCIRDGRYEAAVARFRLLLKTHSKDYNVVLGLLWAYILLGRYHNAELLMCQHDSLPTTTADRTRFGAVLATLIAEDDVLRNKLYPGFTLGELVLTIFGANIAQKHEDALLFAQEAATVACGNPFIQEVFCQELTLNGKKTEAIDKLKDICERFPTSRRWCNLAWEEYGINDKESARAHVQKTLEIDPLLLRAHGLAMRLDFRKLHFLSATRHINYLVRHIINRARSIQSGQG